MCTGLHSRADNVKRKIILTTIESVLYSCLLYWLPSCNPLISLCLRGTVGCHLSMSFGYTSTAVMPIAVSKKKRSLLPVLTVLFLFSYGLMTLLIVEQGSVIQSQRNLIKVLMRDSTQFWAAKGKALGDQQMAIAQGHAQSPTVKTPSSQSPSTKTPSSQTPSMQAPSTGIPSSQDPSTQAPQRHIQNRAGKMVKPQTQLPPAPASDLVDRRRALNTI